MATKWLRSSGKAKTVFIHANLTNSIRTYLGGELEKQSMFTFTFNVCGILIIVTIILALGQVEKIGIKDIVLYPNYLLLFYINLVGPALFIAAVVISFFLKKPLLNAVSQETNILCVG